MFGGMAKSILSAAKAQMSQGNPVTDQVTMIYEELVQGFPEGASENEVPLMKIRAAQEVESVLLAGISTLVEGIAEGGNKVTETQARRRVIEDVRNIKLTALEEDGNVNPLDLATIKFQAMAFKTKAQKYLTNLCLRGTSEVDSVTLDQVEDRLLNEITETAESYEEYMRAAQGAVFVVADIRLARMVAHRIP
jgi:hypothetical protein